MPTAARWHQSEAVARSSKEPQLGAACGEVGDVDLFGVGESVGTSGQPVGDLAG
jgi:hypothetical protein